MKGIKRYIPPVIKQINHKGAISSTRSTVNNIVVILFVQIETTLIVGIIL